jgi:uncharacterized oligopeptide transporter (OPT) family protein
MENKDTFNYSYSAKEQAEIKAIRQKYQAPEEAGNKMEQLRRLDGAVTQKATTVSLVFGVIGALVLGSGMSLAMTNIGEVLGLSASLAMLIGIPVGVLGILLISLAYPVYNRTIRKERKKVAPEILRLTDELMK